MSLIAKHIQPAPRRALILAAAAALFSTAGHADEASPAAVPPAEDWGHLVAYVQLASDYRFYGYSESNRQPVVQGGLHWLAPDNFYAGVFVSRVRFNDFRGTSVETDFYAGKKFYFDSNELNLEVLYGEFPDTAGHPSYAPPGVILPTYNFPELMAELTHTDGDWSFGGKAILEPRPQSHGGLMESVNFATSYKITEWLKASANVGHEWSDSKPQNNHWDIGLTATRGWRWALDVRYYATDIPVAQCYNTNWCKPALVAKATYTFALF